MTKEQKIYAMSNIHGSRSKIIRKSIEEDKFNDEDLLEDALITLLQAFSFRIIREKMNQFADIMKFFKSENMWVEIDTIFKISLDNLIECLEKNESKEEESCKIMITFANQMKEFMDMGNINRQMILNYAKSKGIIK